MKFIYIINQFQTQGRTREVMRRIEDLSRRFGRDYEFRINKTLEDVGRMKESYRDTEYILTAVGGDGSIHHLLNDIVGTNNVLSFIPYGTGNDFCRTMARCHTSGIREIDIVRIKDRYFFNVACFGIDADIANDEHFIHNSFLPRSLRIRAGILSHFLSYKDGRLLRVECGGKVIEKRVTSVVVANSQYYGGGYRISPCSMTDDGMMELYILDHLRRPEIAKVILSMKKAKHLNHPAVTMMRTKKAVITSPVPIYANIDGEPLYGDRFELQLIPKGIRLEYDEQFVTAFLKTRKRRLKQ